MTKDFDWKEVDAALQRAAWKGLHGTREERSGRFYLEPKTQAVKDTTPTPFSADTKPKR